MGAELARKANFKYQISNIKYQVAGTVFVRPRRWRVSAIAADLLTPAVCPGTRGWLRQPSRN